MSTEAAPQGRKLLYLGIATFVVTCVVLAVFGSLWHPNAAHVPGYVVHESAAPASHGIFQVTLDTADAERWVGFNFGYGKTDEAAGAVADLYARRNLMRAPNGAVDLGLVDLESAVLSSDAAWVQDERTSGTLQSPVLCKWYNYSYWSHLLTSKQHTYAVRLAQGGVAYIQVVSYYCDPEGPGCLTLRYRLG